MERGHTGLTDYSGCDTTSLDTLYLLITESLPYLFEMKQEEHEVNRQVTFSINGFDMPPSNAMFKHPWWQDDD